MHYCPKKGNIIGFVASQLTGRVFSGTDSCQRKFKFFFILHVQKKSVMNETSRHAFQSATELKNIFITISFLPFVFKVLSQEFYTSNSKPFKIIS